MANKSKRIREYTPERAAAAAARYRRDIEASRARHRAANERARRKRGDLTMAEYRAKLSARSAARRAQKQSERAEAAEIRRMARTSRPKPLVTERQRQQQKAWREANRDRVRELIGAWRLRNPGKRREDRKSRKIRKRHETIKVLMKLQRGRCAVCREKLGADLHIDHIMPKKLGGSNARSNLQLTCPPCNLTKHAQHPIDHARSLGRLL